jgi:PDZ domain-containing protein
VFKRRSVFFGLILGSWVVLYLGFALLLTLRVPYRISSPGNLEPIESFIRVEGFDQEPRYYAVYMMSFERPTLFQWMAAQYLPYTAVERLPESREGLTTGDLFRSGQIARNTSIDASMISVHTALDLPIEYDIEFLVSLIFNTISDDRVAIGDRVLAVNGNADFQTEIDATACGDTAVFTLLTVSGETVDYPLVKNAVDGCRFGLQLSPYYRITALAHAFTVRDSLVGGPSSGLMQTLYLYDLLSQTTRSSELKIAGTGTIQIDGRVGAVGGIPEKIYTAYLEQVDVFFVPHANYDAALRAYETLEEPGFVLVPVRTFTEALAFLHGGSSDD